MSKPFMPFLRAIYRTCSVCNSDEERTFTDSFTGREFCLRCVHDLQLAWLLTQSPVSEGDNLDELLGDTDLTTTITDVDGNEYTVAEHNQLLRDLSRGVEI